MKLLTKALTATFIGSLAFIPTPAKAWDLCREVAGYNMCANAGQTYDVIQLIGRGERERFHIQCDPQGWGYSSVGSLSESVATTFVEGYCEGRGTPHRDAPIPDPNSSLDPETRDMTGRGQTRPSQPPQRPSQPPKDNFLN
jgi:hypothetical protein